MSEVFITGHRNPDMDSICSAYAYAELKKKLDPENIYTAVRCGHLSMSLKEICTSMEIPVVPYRRDVYPKVSDVVLHSDKKIEADETLTALAVTYKYSNPSVVPIFDKGEFFGLISVDDITSWVMKKLGKGESVNEAPVIRDIMHEQEKPLQLTDRFEEAMNRIHEFKKRGLAVFDGDEYVGYVTRRCFLKTPKYRVILMDHNEPGQSIRGIETAEIVEIIDHHRLDSMKTTLPIFIDAEPLGSTCTIVFRQYLRNGLVPEPTAARALLAGIISDTLILRSPTTTAADRESASKLADICGVDVEEFGLEMFSHMQGLKKADPAAAIISDFKTYREKNAKVGISQCEVTTLIDYEEYLEDYLEALNNIRLRYGIDWAVLMITDVLREHSILLSTDYSAEKHLPYNSIGSHVYDMPGVMSRKKQLLPEILHSLEI